MTFALRMSKIEHMDKLEKVCADCGPLELRVKEFFLSSVDRIRPVAVDFNLRKSRRDAEVYCIGSDALWVRSNKKRSLILTSRLSRLLFRTLFLLFPPPPAFSLNLGVL